jgi:hypothetical protein
MTTATRTWRRSEAPERIDWLADDGNAYVSVSRTPAGWFMEVYEATGGNSLSHPASYLGPEPLIPARAEAVAVAQHWVRKLTRSR